MDQVLYASTITFSCFLVFLFLKKNKKSTLLFPSFYLLWTLTFLSSIIATSKNPSINEFVRDSSALYFFVFLLAIPPVLYSIIKGHYLGFFTLKFEKHAYIPLGLFVLNTFCLLYLLLGYNEKLFTSQLIENVVTYVNYIAILLLFPLVTIFYIYHSVKLILFESKTNNLKLYRSIPFFIILLFIVFITCLFLNQIKNFPFKKYFFLVYSTFFFTIIGYFFYRLIPQKTKVSLYEEDDLIPQKLVQEINDELLKKLAQEKLFLDPNLSITTLAKEIHTNSKYLSYVINLVHGVNFSVFINLYKIEESKKLLLQKETANYTIETIANMSGFHSKSSFNSVFKKTTGQTPSEFKNS